MDIMIWLVDALMLFEEQCDGGRFQDIENDMTRKLLSLIASGAGEKGQIRN